MNREIILSNLKEALYGFKTYIQNNVTPSYRIEYSNYTIIRFDSIKSKENGDIYMYYLLVQPSERVQFNSMNSGIGFEGESEKNLEEGLKRFIDNSEKEIERITVYRTNLANLLDNLKIKLEDED